jgi:uncharacterized BrkB/YihY/UPF0761 family membrane protein
VLAAGLAHSGFVSLFPLLLVLVTILGLIASGDPSLRHEALNAVAKQVPLIGHQLAGNVHQLRRSSVIGLVVGLLALTWGTTGLAQAGLHTMAQVWNLPGPARPGYLQRLGRAALFLGVLGLGVIVTTLLTSLSAYGHNVIAIAVLLEALAAAANIGMYLIGFRVLTPKAVPTRKLVPGAVAGGVAWTVLQALGTYVVHHFPAQRLGVRRVRDGARAPRLDLPGRRDHRVRRRDQRGSGAAAVAALHRPAAAHPSRPGRPGGSGTAKPAAGRPARRSVV